MANLNLSKFSRIVVLTMGITLSIYESFATEVRNGYIYSFLLNQTNPKAEFLQHHSISVLVATVFFVILFIQIRIKIDYWKKRHNVHPFAAQNLENFDQYNKGTIFFVLSLATISGIIVFLRVTVVQSDSPNYHLHRLQVIVAGNAVLFNVVPIVLILRNKNITDSVLKFFGLVSTPSHVINAPMANDPNNNFPEPNLNFMAEMPDTRQSSRNQILSVRALASNSNSLPNVQC